MGDPSAPRPGPPAPGPGELPELVERLFHPTLDRLMRFKGRSPHSLGAEVRQEVLQETWLEWLSRRAGGWDPPPAGRARDKAFIRLVGRAHYRVARPLLPRAVSLDGRQREGGDEGLEIAAGAGPEEEAALREAVAEVDRLPPATRCILELLGHGDMRKKNGRPNARRIAETLGVEVRQVRLQLKVLQERLGRGPAHVRFWAARLAEALFDLARHSVLSLGDPRLARDAGPQAPEAPLRRVRRCLARLSQAPAEPGLRAAFSAARRTLVGLEAPGPRALGCLAAVERIRGPSASLHLWRAEALRLSGNLAPARRELRAAAAVAGRRDRRAVRLSLARLHEAEGRFEEGLAALGGEGPWEGRDAVVLFDRMVLLALAGRCRERDGLLAELALLPPAPKARCRLWVLEDPGPFGARLAWDGALRRRLFSVLA